MKKGILLALESSGETGGAAVLRDGTLVAEVPVSGPRAHGRELMICVEKALKESDVTREDLTVISVNRGPGSYTGLRIGMACAATIASVLDVPMTGVDALDIMALQFAETVNGGLGNDAELWPLLDARRGQAMTACFKVEDGVITREGDQELLEPAQIIERASDAAMLFGTGLPPYREQFNDAPLTCIDDEFGIQPRFSAFAAWRDLAQYDSADAVPRDPVPPNYFRPVLAQTIAERAKQAEQAV